MKIVFMGTPDFAAGVLNRLIEEGYEITGVVTQPDRPQGRKKELVPPPVKVLALEHNIPVFQPVRIKNPEEVATLRKWEADMYVVAAFGQILSREILDIPPLGSFCVHASLLPKYRGAAPIQWSIIDGEKETGVTIMRMDEGIDTGDMVASVSVPILPTDTGDSLHDKLTEAGAQLCVDVIPSIVNHTATFTPQDDSASCYAKILKKEMGNICWSDDAAYIERLIRAFTSWPGTSTIYKGRKLKVMKAEVVTGVECDAQCGSIISVNSDSFLVKCKNDDSQSALKVTMVQPEGKKPMSVHDFLLGNDMKAGDVLGA